MVVKHVSKTIILLVSAACFSTQSFALEESELFNILKEKDDLLFNVVFNTCDISPLEYLVSEDFEFYHDQGGITSTKPSFIDSIKNNICSLDYRPRRELVENSLEVFPLYSNGELYGAIQMGEHKFYALYADKKEEQTSTAKFTHLWLFKDEKWQLSRVLSYDHQSPDASAAMVQVDWNATVSPHSTTTPSPGTGLLSGSLGTFNVSEVGEIFSIPSDGSLSIIASGFSGGFPNGHYALIRTTSLPFQLEFTHVGRKATDFAVNIIDNNAGILSAFPNPCLVSDVDSQCFVSLFDTAGTGEDIATASLGLNGSLDDESLGTIHYTFTVLTPQ